MDESVGSSSSSSSSSSSGKEDRISDNTLILHDFPNNQWTRLPVLIFDSSGMNHQHFSQFIHNTLILHDFPNIKKLHIQYDRHFRCDPHLTPKIRFATRKNVEDLILRCHCYGRDDAYVLPRFIYNNASLITLELFNCCVMGEWKVNWSRLKVLKLECSAMHISEIENCVSGSPVLELLELTSCDVVDGGVIASKSLKILVFIDVDHGDGCVPIQISCPNLEELLVRGFDNLPNESIENVLSGCTLLCSLELRNFRYEKLVIASCSLKKLVLADNDASSGCAIEISCPNLVELDLCYLDMDSLKLMKPESLVCAALDFNFDCPMENYDENTAKQILEQFQHLQHVKELNIGSRFIKILSDLAVERVSSPLLNCKSLNLDQINFDVHLPGIVRVIDSSPKVEKLVIKLRLYRCRVNADLSNLNDCGEKNYWNSNETVFNCFVPRLQTVRIIGLSEGDSQCNLVLHFVEFLLKNAIALEKMVLVLKDGGTDFLDEVSQKLLSVPKCSQHAIIELLCSD